MTLRAEEIPKGLEPDSFRDIYGTSKFVPFQTVEFFRSP